MRLRGWAVGILFSAVGTSLGQQADSIPVPAAVKVDSGARAPSFMLPRLDAGYTALRDYAGKSDLPSQKKKRQFVILNFWATYCVPCAVEIPELEALAAEFSDDAVLLLVSIDRGGRAVVEPLARKRGFRTPILLDMYQKTAQKYGVEAVPALFLVDREGTVQFAAHGYARENAVKLGELLRQLTRPSATGHM